MIEKLPPSVIDRAKGLAAHLAYRAVLVPSARRRPKSAATLPMGPDLSVDSYWVERGSAGHVGATTSPSGIVTLGQQSAARSYLRCVKPLRKGRQVIPVAIAALLEPLRWTRPTAGPELDEHVYAMN